LSGPRHAPGRDDRLVALFMLALVLFSPWLLRIFGGGVLFGWPAFYLYLFGSWAMVILLLALHMERRDRGDG
jgi:hypothetical protein